MRFVKLFFISLLASLGLLLTYCNAAEEITITTYYPSPYGVYKNLRLYPNDDSTPGGVCTNNGEMYFDGSEQTLYLCSSGIWKKNDAIPIPSGMIAMFDAACPSGWTRFTALDGRVPRGGAAYGPTGGADEHSHLLNRNTNVFIGPGTAITMDDSTMSSSSWPPFLNVIWCKKN